MSELLSSCDAAWIQDALGDTFTDTVTLRNPGASSRGAGGGVVTPTVDTTGVSGRLQQSRIIGNIQEVANRLQLMNPALWFFAYTQTGVTEKTTIIFGSRTFKVQAVDKEGAMGVQLMAICEETTP